MSAELLSRPDLKLFMVDSWLDTSLQPQAYRESGDNYARYDARTQLSHYNQAVKATDFAADRREVIKRRSPDAAKAFADRSMDFVFIDADHSQEGCEADIKAWAPKVKKGGYLGGHDYGYEHLPGVKVAVDAAVRANGWNLETGLNYTWFVKIP